MQEPGWINGDDVARGLVEECPACGEIALREYGCEGCGFDPDAHFRDLEAEYDPDREYEIWGGAGE